MSRIPFSSRAGVAASGAAGVGVGVGVDGAGVPGLCAKVLLCWAT